MSKQFVNLLDAPYSRRESYLAFANNNYGEDVYGKSSLWLCNCRHIGFAMSNLDADSGFRQVHLEALYNGRVVPCTLSTTAEEVIIETRYGDIRFCIGEKYMAMAYSDAGLGLRVTPRARFFSAGVLNLQNGRGLVDFNLTRLLMTPIKGNVVFVPGRADVLPDENGVINVAFEDFITDPTYRPIEEYPTYDQCVADVKAEFGAFCEKIMPELPGEFEEVRLQALWQTWSMMVGSDGQSDYKRPMVKMMHALFEAAFVWQMPMQALWLSKDPELSWQVFRSSFDFVDINGRLTDGVAFRALPGGDNLKPPVQGYFYTQLKKLGIYDNVPVEEKKIVLDGMIKWTEYFLNFRDMDGDGLAEFRSPLETGWEDATYYETVGFPCSSPDLNTFIALQMEAVADLGAECGMADAECARWKKMADELIEKIIKTYWDGEKWIAFNPITGAKSDSLNVSLYMPMILGDRLPKEIVDKCIADIFSPDGFDTPYGLASEGLTSDYFRHGFTGGSIITPTEMLMVMAFEECGRPDLAKKVAVDYCRALKNHGFFHIYNALTGEEDRSLTAFGERGLFWSAWTSSCFFYLANKYGS